MVSADAIPDHARIRRSTRVVLLDLVQPVLSIVAILGGLAGGFSEWQSPTSSLALWFQRTSGWEIAAFAAFGTMSGFSLAALALVSSLHGHERAKQILDDEPGRFLLRTLVYSTWGWLLPALASLLAIAMPGRLIQAVLVVLASYGAAASCIALIALTLFYRRFTVPKPR